MPLPCWSDAMFDFFSIPRGMMPDAGEVTLIIGTAEVVSAWLKSPVWLSVLSQIIQRPITTVAAPDTGNVGNSIIAGLAFGDFSSAQDATRQLVSIDRVVEAASNEVSERRYRHFLGLYDDLKERFAAAARDAEGAN